MNICLAGGKQLDAFFRIDRDNEFCITVRGQFHSGRRAGNRYFRDCTRHGLRVRFPLQRPGCERADTGIADICEVFHPNA